MRGCENDQVDFVFVNLLTNNLAETKKFCFRKKSLVFGFSEVRVKLRLPISSMNLWTMCLSGSNGSSLQMKP